MGSKLEIDLPSELLVFKENIESSIKPFVEIKAKAENNLSLWQSKFGGLPFFPKGVAYPKDSKGQAMFLLAQLNFDEIPVLAPFPERGMLQFYISGESDGIYGVSFENPTLQNDFRVLYFPEVTKDESQLVTDFGFLPKPDFLPLSKQSSLTFKLQSAPMPEADYQFEPRILNQHPKSKYELYKDFQKVYETYNNLFNSAGHKIGGYPYFTQSDPRKSEAYKDMQYSLLFQMDTDDEAGIMWGDVGVANFFISEQDLENKDFSRVFYNWDCC